MMTMTFAETYRAEYAYLGNPSCPRNDGQLMTVRAAHESIGSRVAGGWDTVSHSCQTRQGERVTVVGIVSEYSGVWAIYVLPL